MGLIYEIGKVNSELNNGVLGTLVSDTYWNYQGYSGGFSYSNDLYPDNFGIDVDNGKKQDILFIVKEVIDDNGPKINAHFWGNWQGYCWGVVEFMSENSYLEIFTNFGSITFDDVKNFKDFETTPFSTNSSVQFSYSQGKIIISVKESFATFATFDSQIQSNQLRFGIRVLPPQFGFVPVNIVVWNFNSSWASPPLKEFKYIFSTQRQKGLGLRLSGNVKLYDFYFV
jgi:hypothetical protein